MSTQPPAEGVVPVCYRHPAKETYIRCQRCDRPICPDCMRPAAVGFQCPECVAEGARTTRSARTAYGGERSSNPTLTSIVLIGMNVAVWLAIMATGYRDSRLVGYLAQHSRGLCEADGGWYPGVRDQATCDTVAGAHWDPGVVDGAPWQLMTSVFSHVEPWHIALNMLALWFMGPSLEAVLGRVRFVALYLLSGLAGSVCVLWLSDPQSSGLGASGAIFGLMAALLVVAVKVRGAVDRIINLIILNAVITVVGIQFISWQAHLGGFVGGLVVGAALVYAPRERRTSWQLAGMSAAAVVLVVLALLRFAALT